MQDNTITQLWKELNVDFATFEFSCGGDSMNDTSIVITNKDGETIENDVIATHIDNEVYNEVEFYVNSDGHYQGEFGTVHITLDEENDCLEYSKNSQSEWSETIQSKVPVQLEAEEIEFIKENVLNINGSSDGKPTINYKRDLILSDKDEQIVSSIEDKLEEQLNQYEPEVDDGELDEWYSYTTNPEGEEIEIREKSIIVRINNQVTVFRDDD